MLGLANRYNVCLCVSQAGRSSGPAPRPTAPALSPPAHPAASHAVAPAAAAAPAAVVVERKVEQLRSAAKGAMRRLRAAVAFDETEEAMPVPRDWVVLSRHRQRPRGSSGSGHANNISSLADLGSSGSRANSSASRGAAVSSHAALVSQALTLPEAADRLGEEQQEASTGATVCSYCRYPCHTSGLPACEAAEYLRMWDADSCLKPAFFDASWAGQLPNCSELALVSVGGRCGGRWKLQNQDNFLLHAFLPPGTAAVGHGSGGATCSLSPAPLGASVVGVMDGHGSLGASAARRVRDGMLAALSGAALPGELAAGGSGSSLGLEAAQALLLQAFAGAQEHVLGDGRDYSKSGATAVLCMLLEDSIVAAWAGDSRAVVGTCGGVGEGACEAGVWKAHELTRDHKPDAPGEKARIEAAGGRVTRVTTDAQGNHIGPFRVFLPGQWAPGLAVARAFGDTMASKIGVVPTPEFASFALPPRLGGASSGGSRAGTAQQQQQRQLLIVASDGLFEWLPSQRAVEIAGGAASAEDAAHALVEEAQKKWALQYRGRNCDDISVAVAFF